MTDFNNDFLVSIKAGCSIIQIISHETLRIHAACEGAASELGRHCYIWNRSQGVRAVSADTPVLEENYRDPSELLQWVTGEFGDDSPGDALILLEDFHPDLRGDNPISINRLRNFATDVAKRKIENRTIVLSQPVKTLPVELEKDVQVLEMSLPSRTELQLIMQQTRERFGLSDDEYEEHPDLLEAALGLSTSEAQLAFARAVVARKRLTIREISLIVNEKEQIIRKKGHLEYFHPNAAMKDIGGLDGLKSWLKRRKLAFTDDAREYGLEIPRGVLLLGLPGSGKSLTAKAVASAWQMPLLRLDMGRIFGGIVGQSEENMRNSLHMAETISPCVLWIDEIEKGLSGMQSSGATDGGTTSRVLGSFLTWMQEKTKPVFVVATANQIAQLPPELLRKGRLDEIFFVDLPTIKDRKEIFRIHLKKRGDRDELFSEAEFDNLSSVSAGFTGAEIEESVKEGLFMAFDEGRQLEANDIENAIKTTSPISKTMQEVIQDTRKWAKGRAVPASTSQAEPISSFGGDGKSVRLKQEGVNPFVKG